MYDNCLDKQLFCVHMGKILALTGAPPVCGFKHPIGELLE